MKQSPTAEQVKLARSKVKLTQAQAADIVDSAVRIWRYYEAGQRKMPSAIWELFLLKTGQKKLEISELVKNI